MFKEQSYFQNLAHRAGGLPGGEYADVTPLTGAHNSHLGDARFTDMGKSRGEVNLGQLTRQR
jgi:Erythromycin esterase